jgi:hypothetical protein
LRRRQLLSFQEYEQKLHDLAAEDVDSPHLVPSNIKKRSDRKEIEAAFTAAFQMVGGTSRLAMWADANYGEFVKIFSRLLPKESLHQHSGEVIIRPPIPPSPLDVTDETTEPALPAPGQ